MITLTINIVKQTLRTASSSFLGFDSYNDTEKVILIILPFPNKIKILKCFF